MTLTNKASPEAGVCLGRTHSGGDGPGPSGRPSDAPTAPLIDLQALTLQLGGDPVLQDIDFTLGPGEIVTVVGPNGSGKSTLLRVIIGALSPSAGTVDRRAELRIGYVPQRLHIDPHLPLTVRRFLALPERADRREVAEALARAGVPDLPDRQMTQLSGGQFQRVLLARALIGGPDILVLDEATQGLDQPGTADFYRQIAQLRHELGCAVVMVSHDLNVVMSASDRVVCLNRRICCEGGPEAVASAPEYQALFGQHAEGALAFYRHGHGQAPTEQSTASEARG
jgi:zinc transport system ATP-binding protein